MLAINLLQRMLIAGLAGAAAMAANVAAGQSVGCMRMPSTLAQYIGCGYGAGHHAPIVRTPLQRPERVQRMMLVAPCEGQLQPAGYAPIGCHGGDCLPYERWEYAPPAAVPTMAPPISPLAPPTVPAGGVIAPEAVPVAPATSALPPYRTSWRMVVP